MIKLVIDTNALLVSIPRLSAYHWLFQAIIKKQLLLFVTTEILSEYEEVLGNKLSPQTATSVIRTLIELDNVVPTTVHWSQSLVETMRFQRKTFSCYTNG
ncbi:MAG: PIN domain-containing protein [Cyclobacteriaceae bacterium]|nr:PIN domain-containing protein [Cyclobacteriaceae bacterium]